MAEKVQQPKEVEPSVEDVKSKVVEKSEDIDKKEENENKTAENGDAKENTEDDSKDEKENDTEGDKEDKCCVKRKSTGGGDATDNPVVDGATPEKKTKLDEPVEAESKEEAKVEA